MKSLFSGLLIIVSLFFTGITVYAQAPPPPPAPAVPSISTVEKGVGNGSEQVKVKKGAVALFNELQSRGTYFIKRKMDILRDGFNLKTFLIISFFSLLYGVLHTLGPGHGKLIIVSFFMRDTTSRADAFSLSVIISLIHASGAVFLAVLFKTLLSTVKGLDHLRIQYGFTLFSGILVFILGIVYMIRKIKGIDKHYRKDEPAAAGEIEKLARWKRNLFIGFSIGIVPCPLSLTIMMLSIIYGIFWVGITSVLFLTLAMVAVLYALSVYTIKSRDFVFHESESGRETGIKHHIHLGFEYFGNSALILLGAYFILKGWSSLV